MKIVLVGGFLGSGKTTAIVNAARLLIRDGKKVAIIANDQGSQQVDGEYVKSLGIAVREVSNGCFCCNYEQLNDHLDELAMNDPDVVFAESVGTCTDLIATVVKPILKFKPEMEISICIVADAALVSSIIAGHSSFAEESVRYIYKKQLAEADLLILNKIDLVNASDRATVDKTIRTEYPGKIILHQNSLDEQDIGCWLEKIFEFTDAGYRQSLDIDYEIYGAGEAHLAWLDKTVTIKSSDQNALQISEKIIASIADQIQSQRFAIGHLKFLIECNGIKEKVSITSTSTSVDIKLSQCHCAEATVLINARVETDPSSLKSMVDYVLAHVEDRFGCKIMGGRWSAFRPGFPRPMHRIIG